MPLPRFRITLLSCLATAVVCVGIGAGRMDAQKSSARSTTQRSAVRSSRTSTASTARRPRRAKRRSPPPPPPLVPGTPFGIEALADDMNRLFAQRVQSGVWGAIVTSADRKDTLFAKNADLGLKPASTQKLLTTILAFDRLGVHHQLSTDVLADGRVDQDGVLRGSLILHGEGDPAFSARFVGGTPEAPIRELAQRVFDAGVRRVDGDLVADAEAFENQSIPDGWLARYRNESYAAPVSPLSLNGNLLHVTVTPGASGVPQVSVRPAIEGLRVVNGARVRARSRGSRLSVSTRADGVVATSGWIGRRAGTRVYSVVVHDPTSTTAAAFRRALKERGIVVTGQTRRGSTPATAVVLGRMPSPPLAQLAAVMNGESDNHFAELLLRGAARGREHSSVGSAHLANAQLQSLLAERAGTAPSGIRIVDGSGLSPLNRVTPRAMVEALMYAQQAPWASEFVASLPVAGLTETLRGRMRDTPAHGNLRAKTGTTNEVASLSGFVRSQTGELLAFSVFYNGPERDDARATIDAVGATLAGLSR